METVLWMIAGIIMFAITIFVHRHSYEWKHDEEPIALPRWMYWTMLLIALVPILNVVCFVIGAGVYMLTWSSEAVLFRYEAEWWTKMWNFLNKGV